MRSAALAIVFTLLPIAANAQIGNPGFMAPDTVFDAPGVPAPNQPNTTDKLFVRLVGEGGLAEVTLGQLATGKAQASSVEEFARRMVDDHSGANDDLADLADNSGILVPEELNPEHAAMRDQLDGLEGEEFDLTYMRGQVIDHQKTATLLIWEIGSGQDAELQQFAAATLPVVLEHLRMARGIVAELSQ